MPEHQVKQLVFGPVVIEWDARFVFPIVVDLSAPPGWFRTQCEVTYRYGSGDYPLFIRENYSFDGASIPWLIRIVPGFAKLDWHLLATLPHDFIIDHPKLLPRSVADGIFVSVLVALAENRMDASRKLTKLQGYLMFFAVWTWTIWTRILHPPNIKEAPPEIEVPPAMESAAAQASAVSVAKENTKEETAEAPPQVAKATTDG